MSKLANESKTWFNEKLQEHINPEYNYGYSRAAHDISEEILNYIYHSVDFDQQQFIMLKNYITELGIQV